MKHFSENFMSQLNNQLKEIILTNEEKYEYTRNSFNNMAFWLAQVRHTLKNKLSNEIIPKTEIYQVPPDLAINSCDTDFTLLNEFVENIQNKTKFDLTKQLFIRGSVTSGKHNWKNSCYYSGDKDTFSGNISHVLYESWLGPEEPCTHIFLREFIETNPVFIYERFNNMPITKEIRCAITEDSFRIYKYWPYEAFENDENIKNKLDIMYSILSDEEINYITSMNRKIYDGIKSYHKEWSIDWLQDYTGKWWMIDMARLQDSYINKEDNAIINENIINTPYEEAKNQINSLTNRLLIIQDTCEHLEKYLDEYWIDFNCNYCGKTWKKSQ